MLDEPRLTPYNYEKSSDQRHAGPHLKDALYNGPFHFWSVPPLWSPPMLCPTDTRLKACEDELYGTPVVALTLCRPMAKFIFPLRTWA